MLDTLEIAVPIPGESLFTYSVPDEFADGIELGKRVVVPMRSRRVVGYVVGEGRPPEGIELKDIIDIIDEQPLFDEKRLKFYKWISGYYQTSLGIVLKTVHPAGLGVSMKKTLTLINPRWEAESIRLADLEIRVLMALEQEGEIAETRLQNIFEGLRHETLNALARRGFIKAHYRLVSEPKIKYRKVVRSLPANKDPFQGSRVGETKRQIFGYVTEKGGAGYEELKELFGDIGPHIAWLKKKSLVEIDRVEMARDPYGSIPSLNETPPELNIDQKLAYEEIKASVDRKEYAPFLLHGVTGSGKTEVYMRVIDDALKAGRQAIVLVPEISLTPQLVQRFRSRFPRGVAVLHSALSHGERFDAWRMASRGEVDIVIGARSALFVPFKKLGVIVVDEEHETSYKQEEAPTYNARDLAMVLGKMTGSVVILGSATPSVETFSNTLKGKIRHLSLPLRVLDRPLPRVRVVDMREEQADVISRELENRLRENFEKGSQTILFLNRRGFSTILGGEQQELIMCPNCSIPFTYHAKGNSVMCHYCGTVEGLSQIGESYGGKITKIGMGTERVEQVVRRILPGAVVERMDSDAVGGKRRLLSLYKRIEKGDVDVLIGTQMVAKGHDLPGVTLVGVISADFALGIPDFRAGERTFQLLTQVAGRSGRGDKEGLVIVQTYSPEHPSVRFAVGHDTSSFIEHELELRKELDYPPFTRLINLRLKGRKEGETKEAVQRIGKIARKQMARLNIGEMDILGPSQAPVYRVRNQFRWQMLMRSSDVVLLHRFVRSLVATIHSKRGFGDIKFTVDVDPVFFT